MHIPASMHGDHQHLPRRDYATGLRYALVPVGLSRHFRVPNGVDQAKDFRIQDDLNLSSLRVVDR